MGCKILKRVIWPWPRHFQGRFFIGRKGLTTFFTLSFTYFSLVNRMSSIEDRRQTTRARYVTVILDFQLPAIELWPWCIHAQNIEVDYECKRTDMTDRITFPFKAFCKIIIVCTEQLTVYRAKICGASPSLPNHYKICEYICSVSQSYPVGGSNDAAIRWKYCRNVLCHTAIVVVPCFREHCFYEICTNLYWLVNICLLNLNWGG